MDNNKIKKIIFFKVGALGDILMTTPLLREIRKKFPDAQIDYWVGNSFRKILIGNPNINNIIPFEEKNIFGKNPIGMLKLIAKVRKEKYDLGFILDKHFYFSLFGLLAGIKYRIGFKKGFSLNNVKIDRNEEKHEIEYYFDLGEQFGINRNNKKMVLVLSEEDDKVGREYSKEPFVAIINAGGANPGEASEVRKIPKDLFEQIVLGVSEKYNVVLIGGPTDTEFYNSFNFPKNVHNEAGKYSLQQSTAIMKYAKQVITTDSGPMHLAACVNDHIISLFGPTNPVRKAPLTKGSVPIWKDRDIYEEEYELSGKLPKSKDFFKKIAVEEVLKQII